MLRSEADAIAACASRLESNDKSAEGYKTAIQLMFEATAAGGKVVVTGVGKSGKIGEKLVATFLSTGTSAAFMHPVEALHGDLGLVDTKDVVLALSYSGNTEEVIRLIPSLERRGVPLIGLGGNGKSRLAQRSAAWIDGHVDGEIGGDLPAPTSSTTVALALGDTIAITLANARKFAAHDFAMNHPGGSLGRRLLLRVNECCVTDIAQCPLDASLDRVLMAMTRYPRCGGVIVTTMTTSLAHQVNTADSDDDVSSDGGAALPSPPASLNEDDENDDERHLSAMPVGVITHDTIHALLKDGKHKGNLFDLTALHIMSPNPPSCLATDLALDALQVMKDAGVPLLPVMDKKKQWHGVVNLKDLQELF